MTRQILHPLFQADTRRMAFHIFDISGDRAAALRRIHEMDALISSVLENPFSGARLDGDLEGCLVRHGGRDQKIRVVFEPSADGEIVFFIVASFGGQNWVRAALDRRDERAAL